MTRYYRSFASRATEALQVVSTDHSRPQIPPSLRLPKETSPHTWLPAIWVSLSSKSKFLLKKHRSFCSTRILRTWQKQSREKHRGYLHGEAVGEDHLRSELRQQQVGARTASELQSSNVRHLSRL